MTKYFISELMKYDSIGFDVDGTLYDEFDFISQAYRGVAGIIAEFANAPKADVYEALCSEWKQFGSSKTTLFQDVYYMFSDELPENFIKECVNAFRSEPIELSLSDEAKEMLNTLKSNNKDLFIVTDGNSDLQRKKIYALGLDRWFSENNIAVSGDWGSQYQKPSPHMFQSVLKRSENKNTVFLGDRDADEQFAENINADFIRIIIQRD